MSATTHRAPGFFWLLIVFFFFTVAGAVLSLRPGTEHANPRDGERAQLAAEIKASHQDALTKMGLVWGDSSKTLSVLLPKLQGMAPSTSAMVVPGSPTQLKQAAAAAPAAATTK
jgi:hypothetical protein